MKKWLLIAGLLGYVLTVYAAGIVANRGNVYLEPLNLLSCDYEVNICNEVAVVKVTETFRQNYFHPCNPRYIYPLPVDATATAMRWQHHNVWRDAHFATQAQHPIGNPAYLTTEVLTYLGEYPFIYDIYPILAFNDTVKVELTYVQMLTYENGVADLLLKSNIGVYQSLSLQEQSLQVNITSDRIMTQVLLLNHATAEVTNNGNEASVSYNAVNQPASTDYQLQYTMEYEHPGTQVMSTFRDSVPDNGGQGFFAFYAEPDPSEASAPMRKVYTLLIDRSGSMLSSNKLVQAQQSADYIVDHLNPGDNFNILAFNNYTITLWEEHRPKNHANTLLAHEYIAALTAEGSTNMEIAFTTAINQFGASADSIANIIIFMTDGEPTEGIGGTQELSAYVDSLVAQTGTGIFLFSFGIGPEVNEELLNLLSENNQGTAHFVGTNEIYNAVTYFYNTICNPLVVEPVFSFMPANSLSEIYPNTMSNLYQGRKNVLVGRYSVPQEVQFAFDGHIFNQEIAYNYQVNLSSEDEPEYAFLPQLWAHKKVDELLVQYYACVPDDPEAVAIRQEISDLCAMYNILAIFDGVGQSNEAPEDGNHSPKYDIRLKGSFPNPFSAALSVSFKTGRSLTNPVELKIYNTKGQLIRILARYAKSPGDYELVWDGKNMQGKMLSAGVYFYTLSSGRTMITGKATLLK